MASLTTEGLNPLDLNTRASVVMNVPDEAMVLLVQAMCDKYAYQYNEQEGPGQFALRMTLEQFWAPVIQEFRIRQAVNTAQTNTQAEIKTISNNITIQVK